MKPERKNARNLYLRNENLLRYIAESKAQGRMTDDLAKAFMMLAERISKKWNWKSYSYREEMVGQALVDLCKGWHKFDETRFSNPFAYYTQVVHRAFLAQLEKEKAQGAIRDEIKLANGLPTSWALEDSAEVEE